MFKVKTPRKVKEAVLNSSVDLEEEIRKPLKALLAKETMFLEYLGEISLTGKTGRQILRPLMDRHCLIQKESRR